MRNIIITLVLIFIHSISLNVFWYDNSNYKPWEIIVEYNNSIFLNNKTNDSSCSYAQQSKKTLEENWLTIKESIWNITLISFDTNRDIEEIISLLSSDSKEKCSFEASGMRFGFAFNASLGVSYTFWWFTTEGPEKGLLHFIESDTMIERPLWLC